MWEARHFLSWHITRTNSVFDLSVRDVDAYFEERAPGLRRRSLKDVAERLRSLLRISTTPATPPPIWRRTSSRRSSMPMRPSPPSCVRTRSRRCCCRRGMIHHRWGCGTTPSCSSCRHMGFGKARSRICGSMTSTGAPRPYTSAIPKPALTPSCHSWSRWARLCSITCARDGRKPTRGKSSSATVRPIVRSCGSIARFAGEWKRQAYSRRQMRPAHLPACPRGQLLRASVPQKIIGDLLGHRSTEATIPYLKLATEDLRAIALEVPGHEVRP